MPNHTAHTAHELHILTHTVLNTHTHVRTPKQIHGHIINAAHKQINTEMQIWNAQLYKSCACQCGFNTLLYRMALTSAFAFHFLCRRAYGRGTQYTQTHQYMCVCHILQTQCTIYNFPHFPYPLIISPCPLPSFWSFTLWPVSQFLMFWLSLVIFVNNHKQLPWTLAHCHIALLVPDL